MMKSIIIDPDIIDDGIENYWDWDDDNDRTPNDIYPEDNNDVIAYRLILGFENDGFPEVNHDDDDHKK